MPESRMFERWRRGALVALMIYASVIWTTTHWPRAPEILSRDYIDKLVHLAAYAALGWLATLNLSLRGVASRAGYGALIAGLAALAAIDEITQPPFGRASDPLDWVADVSGIIIGVAVCRWIWNPAKSLEDGARAEQH